MSPLDGLGVLVRSVTGSSPKGPRHSQREALHRLRDALRHELDRSRRYEHTFVILRADLAGAASGETRARLTTALARTMRTTDVVCVAERHLYLLLPEVGLSAAERVFGRVRGQLAGALREDRVTMAAFPDDGVTLGAILGWLRSGGVSPARGGRLLRTGRGTGLSR